MKLLYKIIAFFVSLVAIMFVLPTLFVHLPADAGMGMMFILFLVICPIYSVFVGVLTATDLKKLFWMPFVEAVIFPVLFAAVVKGWVPELYIYSIVYFVAAYLVVAIAFIVKMIMNWEKKVSDDRHD